jgi:YHS domain-containing protein
MGTRFFLIISKKAQKVEITVFAFFVLIAGRVSTEINEFPELGSPITHKERRKGRSMNTKVNDPVCGMQIDPINADAQITIQGKTYYFCSQECKKNLNMEPQKYSNKVQQPEHHG